MKYGWKDGESENHKAVLEKFKQKFTQRAEIKEINTGLS